MKTVLKTVLLGIALSTSFLASAQQDKKPDESDKVTIKVRMSEEKDGKTQTVERTYTYKNLSEAEREAKVKSIVDSLRGDGIAKNRRLSVVVEEGEDTTREDRYVFKYKNDIELPRVYRFDDKVFADKMERIEKDLHPRLKKLELNMDNWARDFEPKVLDFWGNDLRMGANPKPASIRGLNAFSNNPETQELNVRFYAPNKGDVTISVMDIKGRQVAKKEIKDFQGDYVGQIELDKNAKGTYFLSVVQNEDGAVRRVVIP